jgi:hypothetical protein
MNPRSRNTSLSTLSDVESIHRRGITKNSAIRIRTA